MQNHLVFDSKSESYFYSQCIERYALSKKNAPMNIVECGSGDGMPIIRAVKVVDYQGSIVSYEINEHAHRQALENIRKHQMMGSYQVFNQSFFDAKQFNSTECLISDPPFLPCLSNNMIDPYLRGGNNGNEFTKRLFEHCFDEMIILIPSYTDPIGTIEHARDQGYDIIDFMISPMELTFYSKDKEVYNRLKAMKQEEKSFFVNDYFLLAGVHFKKSQRKNSDKFKGLIKLLTANW
ncbi:hypothetical protein JMN32_14730 [Fulvivirga sp. 29W222]|uniref:Uncharacterized protein n=1 Tax=Fulvivirga marina TaxID=2494733 RepID=A0A937KBZ0_9BACT|nr:hypothetical protein [Fulvivirga marina]MBL6447571.1 hypothetical protein [Fulvivirga marina]